MRETELVDELTAFGLDERSAKVYYHLSRLGQAPASEVSEASGVQRTEVYRVMDDLEEHGFVEKTLERPRKYVAKPVEAALSSKIEQRRHEVEALESTQETLVDAWPSVRHEDEAHTERFSVHQGRQQVRGLLERMVSNAEEEILVIALRRGLSRLDTMGLLEEIEDSAGEDVSLRALTEVGEDNRDVVERLGALGEVRHLDLPGYAQLVLVDTSEVALFVSLDPVVSTQGTGETVLWLNARDFLLAQTALFDTLWATGIDHEARIDELASGRPADRVDVVRGRWMRYERMKEMLHRAEERARLALPVTEHERLDRSGLARALARAAERGVDVDLISQVDPGIDGVDVTVTDEIPLLEMLTVDGAQALVVMGADREGDLVASEAEWAVWVTPDDAVAHVEEVLDRAARARSSTQSKKV